MSKNNKKFYSKLLLAGEYTATLGSAALAIPFEKYSGQFTFANKHTDSLQSLLTYLQEHHFGELYDLEALNTDILAGLSFDSDIPGGYGLGSSGALVAAIYHHYSLKKTQDITSIKRILALTENAFHGFSSGIDPLVSYLNQPIIISSSQISVLNIEELFLNGFFLLDSGIHRRTSDFVNIFKFKLEHNIEFSPQLHILKDYNENLIQALTKRNQSVVEELMRNISLFEFQEFSEMIPENIKKIWADGIKTGDFYIKLCGAGGGGIFLGWTKSSDRVKNYHPTFLL